MSNVTILDGETFDIETLFTNNGLYDAITENVTVRSGGKLTITQTPTRHIGEIFIDSDAYIEVTNTSTTTLLHIISNVNDDIDVNSGYCDINGDWLDVGATDGTDDQVINTSTYWGGNFIDVIPMIQVETGRRIDFDTVTKTVDPEVGDVVRKTSDRFQYGFIKEVFPTYLVVWWFCGTLADNDDIYIEKVVDNFGPDMQIPWVAKVNNVSGDIKEAGVYQEFGNARFHGIDGRQYFGHKADGFIFHHAHGSTDLTLGHSTVGGFVAPSGCNIRIPNIHFSTASAASYALNNCEFQSNINDNAQLTEEGRFTVNIANFGSYNFTPNYSTFMRNTYVGSISGGGPYPLESCTFTHCVSVCNAEHDGYRTSYVWGCNTADGLTIDFCLTVRPFFDQAQASMHQSTNITVKNSIFTIMAGASLQSYSQYALYFNNTTNSNVSKCFLFGGDGTPFSGVFAVLGGSNVHATDLYVSLGDKTADITASNKDMFNHASTTNCSIIGFHSVGGMCTDDFLAITSSSDLKFRALGQPDSKWEFPIGSSSIAGPNGTCTNISVARMWFKGKNPGYTAVVGFGNAATETVYENCSSNYDAQIRVQGHGKNRVKGQHGNDIISGGSLYRGECCHDYFDSDTTGQIFCRAAVALYGTTNEIQILAGSPTQITSNGRLVLNNGDSVLIEYPYFTKGHTTFTGVMGIGVSTVTTISADMTNNIVWEFQYQIEGGAWNGTWLNGYTASNWTSIPTTMVGGIKLKYKLTHTGVGTNVNFQHISLSTTTTLADQAANFYPIDQNEVPVKVTVIDDITKAAIVGAHVVIISKVDYSTELLNASTDANGVAETTYVHSTDLAVEGWVRQMDLVGDDYTPKSITGNITSGGMSITVELSKI